MPVNVLASAMDDDLRKNRRVISGDDLLFIVIHPLDIDVEGFLETSQNDGWQKAAMVLINHMRISEPGPLWH